MRTLSACSFHAPLRQIEGPLQVRAVFARSWHLQDQAGSILTVTTARFNGPLTIRVAAGRLDQLPVRPGMMGALDGDFLYLRSSTDAIDASGQWSGRGRPGIVAKQEDICLPESGGRPLGVAPYRSIPTNGLIIDLRGAEVWGPRSKPPSIQMEALGRAIERWIERQCSANRGGIPVQGGSGPWVVPARAATEALWRALAPTVDPPEVHGAVIRLLGLGPGLTPSGDDVLCGLLAGLYVLGGNNAWAGAALRTLHEAVLSLAPVRTTALSTTLLAWAGRGVATEPLLRVLWDLSTRQAAALDALLGIGHSSGSDMLTGAVLAGRMVEEMHGTALERASQRVR